MELSKNVYTIIDMAVNNNYKRVVIIGWDGVGAFPDKDRAPQLFSILGKGFSTFQGQSAWPSKSAEGWGAVHHGVDYGKHRVDNDKAYTEPFPEDSPYPSIFKVIGD